MESSIAQVVSCGCCICRDHNGRIQILLVKPSQSKNAWGVPKGHLAAGETFRDCAVRETIEETGVVPKIIAPLPPVITKYWKGENTYEEKTVYGYFAVQCDESQIPNPLDGENSDVRFFDIDSLPPVHKYQVSLIASAIGVAEDYFVKKS